MMWQVTSVLDFCFIIAVRCQNLGAGPGVEQHSHGGAAAIQGCTTQSVHNNLLIHIAASPLTVGVRVGVVEVVRTCM